MELTDWREAVALPIIHTGKARWSFVELETVLTQAIRLCVSECLQRNGGPICTTLSGGLDSSFCLAKIRQLVGPKASLHTFTIGGGELCPDVQFARIVSRRFDTIHHECIPTEKEIKNAERRLHSQWRGESLSSGNVAVFLTYQNIAQHGFKCVIAHDGIDELLGGYWEHRKHDDELKKAEVFKDFWGMLEEGHLLPLERKAQHFGIQVLLPYLQTTVVNYIAKIPFRSRTTFRESKVPLRTIARKYLPREIVRRKKKGFCSALDKE